MAELPISLTCADYARVMPLATREVEPEGIALTMILSSRGSWPGRAEMLRRAVQDRTVHGGEWSMAQYLCIRGGRRRSGGPGTGTVGKGRRCRENVFCQEGVYPVYAPTSSASVVRCAHSMWSFRSEGERTRRPFRSCMAVA